MVEMEQESKKSDVFLLKSGGSNVVVDNFGTFKECAKVICSRRV